MFDTMVQLAEYQWQPIPSVISKRYYDASLPEAHRTIPGRTLSRNAVPSGIVASRISLLQRFGSGSPDKLVTTSPATATKYHKGSSPAGFGRRLNNRFGHPAIQNARPDQESFPVKPSHTFIRLNSRLKTFRGHHTVAEPNLRMVRSSTQIHLLAESPHKDESFGGKLVLKSKSYNPMRNHQNSPDIDVLEEVDLAGNQTKFISQTSISPIQTSSSECDLYRQKTKSIPIYTLGSENSFITTSSIRRQSVRDLFADYGIDRPAGLVSEQTLRETENTLQSEALLNKCHLCGWINSKLYFSCGRCGHGACPSCDEGSVVSNVSMFGGKNDVKQKLLGTSKPSLPPIQARLVEDEPVKPQSLVLPTNVIYTEPGLRHRGALNPSWRYSDSEIPRETSYKAKATMTKLQGKGSQLPLLAGSQTTKKVKESPFLVADQHIPRRAFAVVPRNSSRARPIMRNTRQAPHQLSREYQYSTSFSDEPTCIPEPQSHPVHRGRQNNISSGYQLEKDAREDTDKGYAADTSVHDENFEMRGLAAFPARPPRSNLRSKTNTNLSINETTYGGSHVYPSVLRTKTKNYSILANSDTSMAPQLRSHSSQIWSHPNIFEEKQVPEYVEFRGYPRTGHSRHDVTAVDSGAVGECQHCLDDCRCTACQNRDHNVRCCTNGDHWPMVHIHHTPSKGVSKEIIADSLISHPSDPFRRSDSTPLSPRTSIVAPLLYQTTGNPSTQTSPTIPTRPLLRSKRSMSGKDWSVAKPKEPNLNSLSIERPGRSIVRTVLNLGKSKTVVPLMSKEDERETLDGEKTGSIPPVLFIHLGIFSQPSRLSHPTISAVPTSANETHKRFFSMPVKMQEKSPLFTTVQAGKNSRVQNMQQKTITNTDLDTGVKESLATPLTPQLANNSFAEELRSHQLVEIERAPQMPRKEKLGLDEPMVHHNVQSVNTLQLPISTSLPRPGSANSATGKKLKLELIESSMTPIDDNPDMSPSPLIRREESSTSLTDTLVAQDSYCSSTEHQCIREHNYTEGLASSSEVDQGMMKINGVTVILHLNGREDLIIKANSWKSEGLKNDGDEEKE